MESARNHIARLALGEVVASRAATPHATQLQPHLAVYAGRGVGTESRGTQPQAQTDTLQHTHSFIFQILPNDLNLAHSLRHKSGCKAVKMNSAGPLPQEYSLPQQIKLKAMFEAVKSLFLTSLFF